MRTVAAASQKKNQRKAATAFVSAMGSSNMRIGSSIPTSIYHTISLKEILKFSIETRSGCFMAR